MPPDLGRRIFELVYDAPFGEAIPSLCMVIVCFLLAEARDPEEAVDDFAVMESFFSTVKNELGERFEAYGITKEELFDDIEVFYNQQRRHSTLGQISPAAFERQAAARQAA